MIEAMSDERLAKIRAWVRPEPGVRQAAGSIDSADMLDEIDRLRANNAELQQKARDTWAAYVGADAMLKASEERERIIQDHRERACKRAEDAEGRLAEIEAKLRTPACACCGALHGEPHRSEVCR